MKMGGGGEASIQVSTKRLVRVDICEFHNGWKIVKQTLPSEIENHSIFKP